MQRTNFNVKTLTVNEKYFFFAWLNFLKPYHKLRQKEIELLALFLYKRHELQKVINDEKLLNKNTTLLLSTDSELYQLLKAAPLTEKDQLNFAKDTNGEDDL